MMRYFRSAPEFGKLAVGGVWEQAVVFRPGQVPAFGGLAGEVACEAFFGDAFFGVRRRGRVAELEDFVAAFAAAMTAADGAAFFAAMRDLGVPLRQRFLHAEVGAEGAWRSLGAVRLDGPAAWQRLMASPLWRDTSHAKAIEFVYDNGDDTTHWFALPVSRGGRIVPEMLRRSEQALGEAAQIGVPSWLDHVAEHDPHDDVDGVGQVRPGDVGMGGQQPGLDTGRGGVEQGQ